MEEACWMFSVCINSDCARPFHDGCCMRSAVCRVLLFLQPPPPLRAPLTRFTASQRVAAQMSEDINTTLTMLCVYTARSSPLARSTLTYMCVWMEGIIYYHQNKASETAQATASLGKNELCHNHHPHCAFCRCLRLPVPAVGAQNCCPCFLTVHTALCTSKSPRRYQQCTNTHCWSHSFSEQGESPPAGCSPPPCSGVTN